MFFQRIKTPGVAHLAYIIADGGRAAIIDPRRDLDEYLAIARANDLTFEYIFETHRQEDFEIGSAELRKVTGARIVSGDHDLFGHSDIKLRDGQTLDLGALSFCALHTPGHTPESTSYAVFLPNVSDKAWGVFTGDALFIGETGRTDLFDPEKTAGNAGLLYDALHQRLLPLGDQTQLFPAHGSGSVCGGAIADRDHSTLGLERASNPAFTLSRKQFIAHKVEERLPRPPYFTQMEMQNLEGGRSLAHSGRLIEILQPADFERACKEGIVIDTRLPEAFAGGHIPGSYSIWLGGLPVFGGWLADDSTPILLVVDEPGNLELAALHLARIGLDTIRGALAGSFEAWRNAGLPIEQSGTMSPRQLRQSRRDYAVLDVREVSEFEAGHIEGAEHRYVGHLASGQKDLPGHLDKDAPIVVTCSVGHRAGLAVSILKRRGFTQVFNLLGGMTAWNELDLPAATPRKQAAAG